MLSRCAYAKKYATAKRDFVLKFQRFAAVKGKFICETHSFGNYRAGNYWLLHHPGTLYCFFLQCLMLQNKKYCKYRSKAKREREISTIAIFLAFSSIHLYRKNY